ncbi:MAG: gamma-glutamyl-gamma-aminobutyrate hydrolase family protein [Lachnospiraceae bacterium]
MHTNPITIAIAAKPGNCPNYENACKAAGFLPIASLDLTILQSCDALLLPGGGDILPSMYGQENTACGSIDEALDAIQYEALSIFVTHKKPVFGICKGLQMINIFFGGTLFQDIPQANTHQIQDGDTIHQSTVIIPCILSDLYGTTATINSNHHQAIDRLGDHLEIVQIAPDDIVEAIRHTTLPIFAVQWHPERLPFVITKEGPLAANLLLKTYYEQFIV